MATAVEPQPLADEISLEKKIGALDLEDSTIEASTVSSSVEPSLKEKKPVVVKTPLLAPAASSKPTPREPLSEAQEAKYEDLLRTVKEWTEIPSTTGKDGPITEDEIMWLSKENLLRYLRATKWVSTEEAAKRLLSTLTWRREYGATTIDPDEMSIESETGKQFLLGYDVEQRVCHYMNPARQNTNPSPRQVQHLVFMVERVQDLMAPEQETLTLMINFQTSKTRKNTSPPLSQGREVLNILQSHYPERLGRACIINLPWVVVGFFKLITPFIDPHTRQKLKFSEDMRQYVPTEQLWTVFNGDVDFQYEHDVYWPAFLKLCAERRAAYKARWEKAGKIYGESEVYMKGGNVPSIGGGERASSEDEPEKENAKADAVKVAAPSLEEVSSEMAIPQETNETPVEDAKETVVAESQVAEAVKTES